MSTGIVSIWNTFIIHDKRLGAFTISTNELSRMKVRCDAVWLVGDTCDEKLLTPIPEV
jgi:hypothetical protein